MKNKGEFIQKCQQITIREAEMQNMGSQTATGHPLAAVIIPITLITPKGIPIGDPPIGILPMEMRLIEALSMEMWLIETLPIETRLIETLPIEVLPAVTLIIETL